MSKVNKSWRIGPCTGEEMKHVWRLLKGAGEKMCSYIPRYGKGIHSTMYYTGSKWIGTRATTVTISYKDFVAVMTAKVDDWRNTTWDARDWTEEQRIQFQEKCFELGYRWGDSDTTIHHLKAKTYQLWLIPSICFCDDMSWLEEAIKAGKFTPKKWEDMFPSDVPSNKPNSPWYGMPTLIKDHDCALYYSRILDTCLKCHPEADLRNNKETWGILDTARREQEFIQMIKDEKEGE